MTKKYLVVDDGDAFRDILYHTFCDDADILTAKNGQEALALVKAHCFDIIITDYNMPVMNGITFLEQARETSNNIYSRSIILTGSIDEEVRSFSERNGIKLIGKPFSIFNLKGTVNMLLEGSGGKCQDRHRQSVGK